MHTLYINGIPTSPEDINATLSGLANTFGELQAFRSALEVYFDAARTFDDMVDAAHRCTYSRIRFYAYCLNHVRHDIYFDTDDCAVTGYSFSDHAIGAAWARLSGLTDQDIDAACARLGCSKF